MIDSPATGPAIGARVRVVFFGSGDFGVPILDALAGWDAARIVAVVSAPDRPAGRGGAVARVPVAARADVLGLTLLQLATLRDGAAAEAIAALRPDLGILADYGRIIPRSVLAIPRAGFLNVHPSLLPRHRGATPVAGAILAGDAETGVSIMVMDDGLDTGPVLAAARWPLAPDASAVDVEKRAADVGAATLLAVVRRWMSGDLRAEPQDPATATLTRPLGREDGRLDPRESATALERRVRAFQPWPGTFIETAAGRLAILAASAWPSGATDEAGLIVAEQDGVALATREGRLRLDLVRPAGGRVMTGPDLRRGRPDLVGLTALDR